ncbi:hypothetical protein [Nocardia sp. alder85J]|uniref:hypothetical protein n=1 Tax=Nocardia sp. alder85J TaxID=2862949 RepID=UPI001CD63960|nr:hypothetical protein [Nocardia sp. alder85J]MCX4097528.1 hypothetical protein [Nocardia sp. alder85J]
MSRRVARGVGRALLVGALPLAVALETTGAASAQAPATAPEPVVQNVSQGVPLEIRTNPDALDHDPIQNGIVDGAAVGAAGSGILGAALGSGVGAIPGVIVGALWGGFVGALHGYYDPRSVPQVLP